MVPLVFALKVIELPCTNGKGGVDGLQRGGDEQQENGFGVNVGGARLSWVLGPYA
jgi:hypothetical protein